MCSSISDKVPGDPAVLVVIQIDLVSVVTVSVDLIAGRIDLLAVVHPEENLAVKACCTADVCIACITVMDDAVHRRDFVQRYIKGVVRYLTIISLFGL